jgi:catechol 2,3-dioxygenase-like lactoylglutathione lyase family enzyme
VDVRNVRWVGIRTDNYEAMVAFLRDVLGLRVNFEEPTTVELETSKGDMIQIFAPGDRY